MLIKPYLAPDGYVVSLQNCVNEEKIAGVVGWGKTLGVIASVISVEMPQPARITPHRGQRRRQAHGVPHRRSARRHHQAREGAGADVLGDRQLERHDQPVGRALVQAFAERHAQRCLGGDGPDEPAMRPEPRRAPFFDQARRRSGAGRAGARLRAREARQAPTPRCWPSLRRETATRWPKSRS